VLPISRLRLPANRLLDFTCCDIDPAILGQWTSSPVSISRALNVDVHHPLARNALLFSLIADGNHPDSALWNIFFHFRINKTAHSILINQCKKLVDLSETLQKWQSSTYGSSLRMATAHTLAEIRRHWELYTAMPDIPASRLKVINDLFKAEWTKLQNLPTRRSTASRSLGPLIMHGCEVIAESLRIYWKTGTLFTDPKAITDATFLNPTFVYSLAGEGCAVHYGTDPLIPFHLAPVIGNAQGSGSPTLSDVIKAAQTQFSGWCKAYRKAVKGTTPPITRFFHGDAIAVCHSLRVYTNSGHLTSGIPVAQWKTQVIQLAESEYGANGQAPSQFNIIHTSNLEDHIGLLNVLIPAVPLLLPGPSSVLYSESLLSLGKDATKEFTEHLHGDITLMGILFGVCPVDYLCGFNSRSNTHELFLQMQAPTPKIPKKGKKMKEEDIKTMMSIGQFQQLVTWRPPSSCDPSVANLSIPPPSFNPSHMATFFYDLYQSLFAQESAMNFWKQHKDDPLHMMKAVSASSIKAHDSREGFVLFLKHIKDRFQPPEDEWKQAIESFNARLLSTWSMANMETLHYQDLLGQLHRYQLFKAPTFSSSARRIGPFKAWDRVPDLIRIVFVIPRHQLAVMENSKADEIGTPPLHCDIFGSNCLNIFSSVHVAFGRAIPIGTPSSPMVRFEEDLAGWKGNSSLVVSFTAPSYLITELEAPERLGVSLSVKNTPDACVALTPKLGLQLRIFSAKLMDTSLVHILPEPPLPARRRATPSAHPPDEHNFLETLSRQIGSAGRSVLEFDDDCEEVQALSVRVEVTDPDALQALQSPAKPVPEIKQLSACVVRMELGGREQDVVFPFPVMGSEHRLRIARTSKYIEVSQAISLKGVKFLTIFFCQCSS